MQIEIMRMSRELNVTVVYVTHDQEEALSMSGRIAVYRDGRIEQVGVPSEVYKNPSSLFVADFVGESTILKGILHFAEHGCSVDTPLGILPVDPVVCFTKGMVEGASVGLVLRPESMHVTAEGTSIGPMPDNAETVSVEGTLEEVIYLGASTKVVVAFQSNNRAVVRTAAENWKTVRIGEKVRVQWKIKDCVVLPDEDV
jgi:putative spermidine/putrescine transport system ATP-binding protein